MRASQIRLAAGLAAGGLVLVLVAAGLLGPWGGLGAGVLAAGGLAFVSGLRGALAAAVVVLALGLAYAMGGARSDDDVPPPTAAALREARLDLRALEAKGAAQRGADGRFASSLQVAQRQRAAAEETLAAYKRRVARTERRLARTRADLRRARRAAARAADR